MHIRNALCLFSLKLHWDTEHQDGAKPLSAKSYLLKLSLPLAVNFYSENNAANLFLYKEPGTESLIKLLDSACFFYCTYQTIFGNPLLIQN